ncbi:MAG TPA: sigma-70 family RNA polymerase sigma factor, partial [Lapillicoccus sp.]
MPSPPGLIGRVTAPEVVSRIWRTEAARLVAGLTRMTQDLALAEDLAQDALVAALEQWPDSGVPDNPGAWLMSVSKRRAIDHFRRSERFRSVAPYLAAEAVVPDLDAAVDHIEDDVLRLMFMSCHPVLTKESRVALTLRLVGGLSTREIARAYLSGEATVAQRISRAKRTIAEAGVPFEVPSGPERPERLASVLEVVYLICNEGYAATSGDDWLRPALSDEALRLGRLLASLAPREPEVHGLLALMQLQASRSAARVGPAGEAVLLRDQDRDRWDADLIGAGLESL